VQLAAVAKQIRARFTDGNSSRDFLLVNFETHLTMLIFPELTIFVSCTRAREPQGPPPIPNTALKHWRAFR
jgi:hypothetical protein